MTASHAMNTQRALGRSMQPPSIPVGRVLQTVGLTVANGGAVVSRVTGTPEAATVLVILGGEAPPLRCPEPTPRPRHLDRQRPALKPVVQLANPTAAAPAARCSRSDPGSPETWTRPPTTRSSRSSGALPTTFSATCSGAASTRTSSCRCASFAAWTPCWNRPSRRCSRPRRCSMRPASPSSAPRSATLLGRPFTTPRSSPCATSSHAAANSSSWPTSKTT